MTRMVRLGEASGGAHGCDLALHRTEHRPGARTEAVPLDNVVARCAPACTPTLASRLEGRGEHATPLEGTPPLRGEQ